MSIHVALEELSIELSNRCLCRCIHCSSGSQPIAGPDELSPQKIASLIIEARELGATVLSLSGGDPILMGEEVVVYVELAREIGYERVLFYTTGIWSIDLDQLDMPGAEPLGGVWGIDAWPYLNDLIWAAMPSYMPSGSDTRHNVLTVIFSLHSHRPEVHDFIMGVSGSWYTITGGILALTAQGVNVEVHMVPMKPNYEHISNVRDMCADMGVSRLSLLRFVPQTRGHVNRGILDIGVEEFQYIQRVLHNECQDILIYGKEHPVKMRPGCPIDFRHTIIPYIDEKAKSCHAGLDLILVRPDGSVHPCAAWKTLPDDANVNDFHQPLTHIWKYGTVFQELRKFHERGYKTLDIPCASCTYLDSCKGGCLAQKLHAYGKTLDAMYYPDCDPLCPLGQGVR